MRLTILAAFLAAAGCDSTTPAGPSHGSADGRKIADRIDRLTDDKSTLGTLKKLFAAGTKLTPQQYKKYSLYDYQLQGNPEIAGDTATATIALRKEVGGIDAGTKVWTFVKEGDQWQLKDAPLP